MRWKDRIREKKKKCTQLYYSCIKCFSHLNALVDENINARVLQAIPLLFEPRTIIIYRSVDLMRFFGRFLVVRIYHMYFKQMFQADCAKSFHTNRRTQNKTKFSHTRTHTHKTIFIVFEIERICLFAVKLRKQEFY